VKNFAQNFADPWLQSHAGLEPSAPLPPILPNTDFNNDLQNYGRPQSNDLAGNDPTQTVWKHSYGSDANQNVEHSNSENSFLEDLEDLEEPVNPALLDDPLAGYDSDQNVLGLRRSTAILKQNILQLDRALLNLQPQVRVNRTEGHS
jgi:hypothetical protein